MYTLKTRAGLVFAALLLIGGGCVSGDSAVPGGKTGLSHPDNDPALVATAQEAQKCVFSETSGFAGYDKCPAFRQIKENAPKSEKGFKTMMNFLEDEDPAIRKLAVHALAVSFYDKALFSNGVDAARAVKAFAKETHKVNADELVSAVTRFAGNSDAITADVVALIKNAGYKHPTSRGYLLSYMTKETMSKSEIYSAVVRVAQNSQETSAIRSSAIIALSRATGAYKQDALAVVKTLATDPDAVVAAKATANLKYLQQ